MRQRAALAAEVAALEAGDDDRREMLEIDLLGATTRVLAEQAGAVDAGRLRDLVGHVAPEQQRGIDEALITVLGLR